MSNLITSKEAKKLNKEFYFTGKPCKHGHICERYVSNSGCVECYKLASSKNGNLYARKSRQKHKDKYNQKGKENYSILGDDYIKSMWWRAKQRAEKKGVPFNIEKSDIVIPEFCPVLNVKLESGKGKGPSDYSPSLDRIIPKLGYIKGNIQVICNLANRIKSDVDVSIIEKVFNFMKLQNDKYTNDMNI